MSSQYAGHVTEVVKNCDLQKYSGLVTVSGDGLIFEVIYLTQIKICENLDGILIFRKAISFQSYLSIKTRNKGGGGR